MSFLEDLRRGIPLTLGQVHGRMFLANPAFAPVTGSCVADVAHRMHACVVGTAFVGSPAATTMVMLDRSTARCPEWDILWPEMKAQAPPCPCGGDIKLMEIGKWDLLALAIHLNDGHGVKRERIGTIIAEQLDSPGSPIRLRYYDIHPGTGIPLTIVMAQMGSAKQYWGSVPPPQSYETISTKAGFDSTILDVPAPAPLPAPPAPVAVPEEAEAELVGV